MVVRLMDKIATQLALIAEAMHLSFTLEDKPIESYRVFDPTGLLPSFPRRANQIATLCLGYGIGISFEEEDNAILGVKVVFDNITPSSLRMMFLVEVIHDIVRYSEDKQVIALDELLYD